MTSISGGKMVAISETSMRTTAHRLTGVLDRRLAVVFGTFVAYSLLVIGVLKVGGELHPAIIAVPVIVAGIAWGSKAGLTIGGLALPLNLLLSTVSEDAASIDASVSIWYLLIDVLGGTAGRVSELNGNLRFQISQRVATGHLGRPERMTNDLDSQLARYARRLGNIVPHDIFVLSVLDPTSSTFNDVFTLGTNIRSSNAELDGTFLEAVIETGIPVRVGGVHSIDDKDIDAPTSIKLGGYLNSAICAPLVYEGEIFGALTVATRDQDAYESVDSATVEHLAALIATTWWNNQLRMTDQQRQREQALLATIVEEWTDAETMADLADRLHRVLRSVVAFDRMEIAAYEPHPGQYVTFFARGAQLSALYEDSESGDLSSHSRIARIGRSSDWGDVAAPPGFERNLIRADLDSWIIAPIFASNRLVGRLTIASESIDAYDESDLALIRRLAILLGPIFASDMKLQVQSRRISRLHALTSAYRVRGRQLHEDFEELKDTHKGVVAANDAKSNLLVMVAKEFRLPVTSVAESVKLMLRRDKVITNRDRRAHLRSVKRSARHLAQLSDNLSDMAEIDTGNYGATFDSVEMVERVIKECAPPVAKKSQHVTCEFKQRPLMIHADENRLATVLRIILDNASTYSGVNTEIQIRVAREYGWFILEVQDNGVGMTDEERSRLFTSFSRRRSADGVLEYRGMGLGIAKSIISMHGGQIIVQSTPGEGSIFRFRVPVSQKAL